MKIFTFFMILLLVFVGGCAQKQIETQLHVFNTTTPETNLLKVVGQVGGTNLAIANLTFDPNDLGSALKINLDPQSQLNRKVDLHTNSFIHISDQSALVKLLDGIDLEQVPLFFDAFNT